MTRISRAVWTGWLLWGLGLGAEVEGAASRPNVLLVIADDMGHGDLGIHGNPVVKTPNLDRLARDGVRLTRFQVAPVCSPTRSSLMTGRYNYRTGVVDTSAGRALMHTDEVTLAEMLRGAGYRTAVFGKWHLGDNAPMRTIDQGFQESLVLKGGGIGQPSDPPGGSSYFDPILQHNGKEVKTKGYCSDVFTDAAIDYIAGGKGKGQPFFVYLSYNAPHTPLEVPESYRQPYAEADLSNDQFPAGGYPLPGPAPKDVTARVYGMVTNIDDNLGRVFKALDDGKLADDTLVIFLTDNGPQQVRYVSGMRGRKGTVYDGGIRVPCFFRWPGTVPAGKTVDRNAAVIDLAPTVLEACGVATPQGVAVDGVSLWPLVVAHADPNAWPDRVLFTQWHRGEVPEKFRAFAARSQRYKLVRAEGPNLAAAPPFQLFDTEADPYETADIAAANPEVVAGLKSAYASWFDGVSRTRGFDPPPRIFLGSPLENPTTLTPQDWRGPRAFGGTNTMGFWEVEVVRPSTFDAIVSVPPASVGRVVRLKCGALSREAAVGSGPVAVRFEGLVLPAGPARFEAWVERDGKRSGVAWAELTRRD